MIPFRVVLARSKALGFPDSKRRVTSSHGVSKWCCSLKPNSEIVTYDLDHVLISLVDEFIFLAHKHTQFIPVLKLAFYVLTGTQKMKEKNQHFLF